MARAAAAEGTVMTLSTAATSRPAEIAAEVPPASRWFQLYCFSDRGVTRALVDEAVDSGFEAIVLTADAPRAGRRERDLRTGFAVPADVTVPAVAAAVGDGRPFTPKDLFDLVDPTLDWDDLASLAAECSVPILLKGVQTAEDATLAVEHGAAGVIVSNHGGRQLDGVPASLDILPEVVDAVGERCEVLMDGGVRRGTDVAVALALGARAVLAGRAPLWGLAAGGEAGARRVLELLREEIVLALALLGCQTPHAVRREHVSPAVYSRLDGGTTPSRGGPAPGPRARCAVRRRLRQRRLVDLLRARAGGAVRARADAGHVHDRGPDLRLHRRHLRRGDGALPGGGRLLELRPPRLQRARLLPRRLGADAHLHRHRGDLGLLRPPLPGRLLGAAGPRPGRRHLRHRAADLPRGRSTSRAPRSRRGSTWCSRSPTSRRRRCWW